MSEQAKPQNVTAGVVIVLMAALAGLAITRFINLSTSKADVGRPFLLQPGDLPKPDLSTLAPGAWTAIRKALGENGPQRITNILSQPNTRFASAQHGQSGVYHGHPYGLAFDIYVSEPGQANADARALRLHGVAAWYRGPGAPGPAGFGGLPHLHCVWPGAPTNNPVNLEQIASFVHRYRAMNGEDSNKEDWIDSSIRPDEIANVSRAYYSVKGRKPLDKIPTYDALNFTH